MNKKLKQVLKTLGFLSLGLLLFYLAFKDIPMKDLLPALAGANFWWIALSLFILGLAFLARARRWMLLIEPLGHMPGFWNTYNSLMFGYLSNFALPRMGEITRCVSLGQKEKIPMDALVGTVIAERAVDLLMTLSILGILMLTWLKKSQDFFVDILDRFNTNIEGSLGGTWVFWLILAGLAVLAALLIFIRRKQLARSRIYLKLKDLLKGVFDGLKTITRLKRKWEFILQSLLIYFFYIMMTWVLVFSLPETSHLKLIDGIFLLGVGSLGMAAPVTAGIGAYHWITSYALVQVFGISEVSSGAFAIIGHEPNSLFTIVLGIISYLMLTMGRKRHKTAATSGKDQ